MPRNAAAATTGTSAAAQAIDPSPAAVTTGTSDAANPENGGIIHGGSGNPGSAGIAVITTDSTRNVSWTSSWTWLQNASTSCFGSTVVKHQPSRPGAARTAKRRRSTTKEALVQDPSRRRLPPQQHGIGMFGESRYKQDTVSPRLPDKQEVMNLLLTQASSVYVHLDPRRDKVVVPANFRSNATLILEIGMNMRVPIPDLCIDSEGVKCTLSFGGHPFWCRLPWPSIFAITTGDQRGMIWPPDVPDEAADRYIARGEAPKGKAKSPQPAAAKEASKQTGQKKHDPNDGIVRQRAEKPRAQSISVKKDEPRHVKKDEPRHAVVRPLRPRKPPMPDTDGNAAGVLDCTDSDSTAEQQPQTSPEHDDKPTRSRQPSDPMSSSAPTSPMPDTDGNAAGVLIPPDFEDTSEEQPETPPPPPGRKPKRKLPPYLRIVR